MTTMTKPQAIPTGYEGAIPYLYIKGAEQAIEFYKKAFGAEELCRMHKPGGIVGHAEMRIGKALFMLADEQLDMGATSPKTVGGVASSVYIYVDDVDALAKRAAAAGAKVTQALETKFYGDRSVGYEDPYGHKWGFATHVEDPTPEQMKERMAKIFGGG